MARWKIGSTTLTELLFVLLPLVVLAVALVLNGETFFQIVDDAEWSFASCVLFGQAIVKVRRVRSNTTDLAMAAIMIFGLAPALVTLARALAPRNPSNVLIAAQMTWFVAAVIVFIRAGSVAEVSAAGHSGSGDYV